MKYAVVWNFSLMLNTHWLCLHLMNCIYPMRL